MKVFKIIAQYDWLLLKRDKLIVLLSVVTIFLAALATWNGLSRLQHRQNMVNKIEAADDNNLSKVKMSLNKIKSSNGVFDGSHFQDPRKPATAGNNLAARYAILPPSPTAILAVGQSDLMPYYYWVSTSKRQVLIHDAEIDNAQFSFIGSFDWAFLLVFLMPLWSIVLSYNIVSSERENGTLPLILAEPISYQSFVFNKFLFRFFLLNTLIISLLGISFALAKAPVFSTDFLLLVFSVLGYSGFWFALSFFINSHRRSSGFNASALVSAWLILLVVMPSLLNILVQQVHPMPSRIELITQTRDATDKARAKGNILLSAYYEDHPELAPKDKAINYDDYGVKSFATATDVKNALSPLKNSYTTTLSKQQALVTNYRFVSPAILMQEMLNNIGKVGHEDFSNFEQQVTVFQEKLFNYFSPKVFKMADMTPKDYDMTPRFEYEALPNNTFGQDNLFNLLFLALLLLGLLMQGNKRLNNLQKSGF
jgi:ABC-2 type transport system permease protein